MNKKISTFIIMFILVTISTGCVLFDESLTVKYENGDELTVTVPRDKNLDISLTKDGRSIEIKEDGKVRTSIVANIQGNYDVYVSVYDNTSACKVLDNGSKDNLVYKSYECGTLDVNTYIYIVKIKDTNLSLLLTNTESKDSSKEIFDVLSFEVK